MRNRTANFIRDQATPPVDSQGEGRKQVTIGEALVHHAGRTNAHH